jgi:hypothetical protein
MWSWRRFASIDPLRRCFAFLDLVLSDLYPACAEELYSDVVIILCNSSFIPVLYGFGPLEIGIARDSLFLGLSQRWRESGFRSEIQFVSIIHLTHHFLCFFWTQASQQHPIQ